MSCVLLTYYVAMIFVCFPNQIVCYPMSTNVINTLMSTNLNVQSDPGYIKWKADQDVKPAELRPRQESATSNNDRSMENNSIERANRQKRYSSSYSSHSKRSNLSDGQIIVIIVLSIVMVSCCACGREICCSDDENATATPATNVQWVNESASTQMQAISVMFSDSFENNDNHNISSLITGSPSRANESNENFSRVLTGSPSRTNIPLRTSRQNSLPSYEEAVKIRPFPPEE